MCHFLWVYNQLTTRLNCLTPNSDKHIVSPTNVTPKPHIDITRIRELITTELTKFWIVKQILLVSTLGNV